MSRLFYRALIGVLALPGLAVLSPLGTGAQTSRVWATYFGGENYERVEDIATDPSGNVYIAGSTSSSTGIAFGGFQNTSSIYGDAYLAKFDPAGNRIWATYYGGSGSDQGLAVATDAQGNVYLGGATDSPGMASGGFQGSLGGGKDAFLVKFDPAGNRLWATYYGGMNGEIYTSLGDYALSVATDNAGNVFLSGLTYSPNNIASGGFQNTHGGGVIDAFLVKFDAAGNRLWGTYYGGTGDDRGNEVTADATGNVYLAGQTNSANAMASGGFQNTFGGAIDAYLAKFDANGNRLWATYYGNVNDDYGFGLSADPFGNIYLAGQTTSTSGIASGGFQNSLAGDWDIYLAKFGPAGNRLWATYYGGVSKEEHFGGIATDPSGNVYLGGDTHSPTNIASNGFQNNLVGGENEFIAGFNTSGLRLCATYFGVNDDENGHIAADAFGNIYLSGFTDADTGIAYNGFQNTIGGLIDVYLAKFNTCCSAFQAGVGGDTLVCEGQNAVITASGGTAYSWSTGATTSSISVSPAGTTTYTVFVFDSLGCMGQAVHTVTVNPSPTVSAGPDITLQLGDSTVLNATGAGPYSWSTGDTASSFTVHPTSTTTYCVSTTNASGCTATDCVTITVELPCGADILATLLPTAFSPNQDQLNDEYCVPSSVCIRNFELRVYDRWGEKVFETTDTGTCWDGRYRERELGTGVFAYYFTAELYDGKKFTQRGNISLIR
jgi:gliding motility-associated-like protein